MKNMIVFLGLLLCLCANSWGACTSIGYLTGDVAKWDVGPCQPNYSSYSASCAALASNKGNNLCKNNGNKFYAGLGSKVGEYCSYEYQMHCDYYAICCSTQAEADSVVIAQKCTSGTMAKDTANSTIFDVCKNGEGLLIAFNNPITGVRNSSIGYYIVTDDSADLLDEATYDHLAALACTEVSLYRGVLNGKYVYWYSTDPEPAGVVNVVRIK